MSSVSVSYDGVPIFNTSTGLIWTATQNFNATSVNTIFKQTANNDYLDLYNGAILEWKIKQGATAADLLFVPVGTGVFRIRNSADNGDILSIANSTGTVGAYRSNVTVGNGIVSIHGYGSQLAQTANVATLTTFTQNIINGLFRVSILISVTAIAVGITPQVTYTDSNSVAQTDSFVLIREGNATPVLTATAVDRYTGTLLINVKSATAITLKTTGYVSGTYDVFGSIEWIG
jgi:hypothetical protein